MCGIFAFISKYGIDNFSELYNKFMKLRNRGPEYSSFDIIHPKIAMGFHRLAIRGLTPDGNQPFHRVLSSGEAYYCVCNGEIYDYEDIMTKYNINMVGESDCGIILPLFMSQKPEDVFKSLGSEFAIIIVQIKYSQIKVTVARDPIGVRPLFYSTSDKGICFSSEAKGIVGNPNVFPPGTFATIKIKKDQEFGIKFKRYWSIPSLKSSLFVSKYISIDQAESDSGLIFKVRDKPLPTFEPRKIRKLLLKSVEKRLQSDRPFGCLLSGGLDSSLVVGLIKYLRPDLTFPVYTIAFESGSTDLPYAKMIAEHFNLPHHVITITEQEAIDMIDETIYTIESYDTTTVRASVMQYILSKKIKDVKVLLVGENSDELFMGYLYFHKAPNADLAREDSVRLVNDVHMFDGLRTDRTMSSAGLEVRLPYADVDLLNYVYTLDPSLVTPRDRMEKWLLRNSCKGIIPDEVLFRRKEAFSDAVSTTQNSWFEIIQREMEKRVGDDVDTEGLSKESYYYRKKFDEYFGKDARSLIPYYWMPKWCEGVTDPSARTLSFYEELK